MHDVTESILNLPSKYFVKKRTRKKLSNIKFIAWFVVFLVSIEKSLLLLLVLVQVNDIDWMNERQRVSETEWRQYLIKICVIWKEWRESGFKGKLKWEKKDWMWGEWEESNFYMMKLFMEANSLIIIFLEKKTIITLFPKSLLFLGFEPSFFTAV